MSTPSLSTLRPLVPFARDAAVYSAFGTIPVGRLRGGQVVALAAASAAIAAVGTYGALRARERSQSATSDGWMPWTPYASSPPAVPEGDDARPRPVEDQGARLRRAAIAAVAGAMSGGVTALGVVADRRMEGFFTDRGVGHPRLAVGLSQGIGYASLTALLAAVVDAREA